MKTEPLETMKTILIHRYYAETTPESADHGDFSDTGVIERGAQVTFRELVDLMREHADPSNSGGVTTDTWFSTGFHVSCYRTGTEREETIHFARENQPRLAKYWAKAHKLAQA